MSNWEPVIGIETHVELSTASKMFCGCMVDFGAEPNTRTCPVCLGLPGALPVANREAIERIVRIGLALECTIAPSSIFHRKNYFYPDLPKNYQISQYDVPVCVGGHLDLEVDGEVRRIGITRVHMEEDTGKSIHQGEGGRIHAGDHTLLDFNRSGVPLVEVVTEPDLRSPAEARRYAQELQTLVRALGVSDARLEEGSMRFDANVSLRPEGSDEYGIRAEVKNMNSLRSLERALEFEIERQAAVLASGAEVVQETRHWDEDAGVTHGMRGKEESSDYRYFPEPDLVPLVVDDAWRGEIAASVPELPQQRRARYAAAGVDPSTAEQLAAESSLGALFEGAVAAGADAGRVANWLGGEVVAYLRRQEAALEDIPLEAVHLAQLSTMVDDATVSATAAKDVLAGVMAGEGGPAEVAEGRDLLQMTDTGALAEVVAAVLAENDDAADKVRSGDDKPIGFLVGQVMRSTGGKADPKQVTDLIRRQLAG